MTENLKTINMRYTIKYDFTPKWDEMTLGKYNMEVYTNKEMLREQINTLGYWIWNDEVYDDEIEGYIKSVESSLPSVEVDIYHGSDGDYGYLSEGEYGCYGGGDPTITLKFDDNALKEFKQELIKYETI